MQNVQDIHEKFFFECKDILERLSKINTIDDLLESKDLVNKISERISFLKLLKENEATFFNTDLEVTENQYINTKNEDENDKKETPIVSEMKEDNLLIINNEEFGNEASIPQEISEEKISEVMENKETIFEQTHSNFDFVNDFSKPDSEEDNRQMQEKKISEPEIKKEESIGKIVEFEKNSEDNHHNEDYFNDEFPNQREDSHEKKFRLAHIKGLKSIKSLFDDDEFQEQHTENPAPKSEPASLLKSNVSTGFMEAEKPKPEFKLDLNDKIAFSQKLFGGSQAELNEAVNQLNKYKNKEEAKEYLSDLYYAKNWQKVDEYAQRLWTLVENKFM